MDLFNSYRDHFLDEEEEIGEEDIDLIKPDDEDGVPKDVPEGEESFEEEL
ncbi:MAG: hypothetical protein NTX55_01245 [Candidatus Parcubacteria bacterium]|nr:hypothetical protein [Candidatus Parcubacteria bacterium]